MGKKMKSDGPVVTTLRLVWLTLFLLDLGSLPKPSSSTEKAESPPPVENAEMDESELWW